jgi:hypothetical protein
MRSTAIPPAPVSKTLSIVLCCKRVHFQFFVGRASLIRLVRLVLNVRSRDRIEHLSCTHKGKTAKSCKTRDASGNSCSHGPLSCHADNEVALLQPTTWNVRPSLNAAVPTTVIVSPLPPGLVRLSAWSLPTPVVRISRRLEYRRKARQDAIALDY